MREFLTEDIVRDNAGKILDFKNEHNIKSGVGQLTTFNQLGFKGISDKPDGWYLPDNLEETAIILETKNSNQALRNYLYELEKNCNIVLTKYNKVIGILYNGYEVIVTKNNEEIDVPEKLEIKNIIYLCF